MEGKLVVALASTIAERFGLAMMIVDSDKEPRSLFGEES